MLLCGALAVSDAGAETSPVGAARAELQGLEVAGPSGPVLLPPFAIRVDVGLEASLTMREVWQPVSVAPDLYLGLPFELTIGVVHSTRAVGLLDSGYGICLTGEDEGCVDPYTGIGVDVLRHLWSGHGFELSARSRFYVARFEDPSKPRFAPGLVARYRWRSLSALVDPHVAFGVVHRDRGNENTLNIPLWLGARIAGPVDLFVRSGLVGGIANFSDKYAIPVGLGVGVRPYRGWRVELQVAFPKLIGPLNNPRPRDLLLRVSAVVP